MRPYLSIIALIFGAIFSSNALALTVDIDPGAYAENTIGIYSVDFTGKVSGFQTFDLAVGVHTIGVGGAGRFIFNVDATGNVTSQNPAAATGSGNTLTFNTTSIDIRPGAYSTNNTVGSYSVFDVTGKFRGDQTVTVVLNLTYQINLGGAGRFIFNVDATGNVTSQNPAAATGSGNILTFNTTTILVDPDLQQKLQKN